MSNELEIAAGASIGGFVRPTAGDHAPVGTPCANCATPLQGPWCHVCGQSAEDFHRSIGRLLGEVVEGLFHVDGRLWRTLPGLILRPGRLTRSYLDGHRAPQIPPLRLFLVVLLGVFLVGGLTSGGKSGGLKAVTLHTKGGKLISADATDVSTLTPQERAKLASKASQMNVSIGGGKPNAAATNWLQPRYRAALADPERFKLVLERWAESFAFLMLPVATLLMSLLFVFQRRFFLFDHAIFSLHSLSAAGIIAMLAMTVGMVLGDNAALLFLALPIHLYRHMRGVYSTSAVGTLLRMLLLFMGSTFAASLLVVGLLAVGLNGMGE